MDDRDDWVQNPFSGRPVRKTLALAAVALGFAGLATSCGPKSSPQSGDAWELGTRAVAALAATAAAKTPAWLSATPTPAGPPADTASLDLLIAALYEGVSHGPDGEPDWARLEPLFLPGARLTPPRPMGDPSFRALSFDEFREAVRQGIAARREQKKPTGFFESEIGREAVPFGHMTQILSAYEARFGKDDPKPFLRGVNAIQVVRVENDRWVIVSIVWDTERAEEPIPERLLRRD